MIFCEVQVDYTEGLFVMIRWLYNIGLLHSLWTVKNAGNRMFYVFI
jgi:hypothetical protein